MRPENVSKEQYTNWLFEQARMDLGRRPAEIGMTTPRVTKGMKGMGKPGEMEFLMPLPGTGGGVFAPPRIGGGLLKALDDLFDGGFSFGGAKNIIDYIRNSDVYIRQMDDDHPFKLWLEGLVGTTDANLTMYDLIKGIVELMEPGRGFIRRMLLSWIPNLRMLIDGKAIKKLIVREQDRLLRLLNIRHPDNRRLYEDLLSMFGVKDATGLLEVSPTVIFLRKFGLGDFQFIEGLIETRLISNLPEGEIPSNLKGKLARLYRNYLEKFNEDLLVTLTRQDGQEVTVNLIEEIQARIQNGDMGDIAGLLTLLQTTVRDRTVTFHQSVIQMIRNSMGEGHDESIAAIEAGLRAELTEFDGHFNRLYEMILQRIMYAMRRPEDFDPV
jgi:hypothetical protein